ncbi:hypothetical protein UXO53_01040 [Enterobacter cloacae]|uniref:hypothetical protein n=1 Tax=Enterobacter cloacae TaxID=550 RepID=UPI002FD598E7
MKEFKGNRGPWVASKTDRSIGPVMKDDDQSYGMIFPVAWVEFNGDDVYQQANANLIAAAPDLLKELQKLRDYVINICGVDEDDCHIEHPLMSSRQAISKALGE